MADKIRADLLKFYHAYVKHLKDRDMKAAGDAAAKGAGAARDMHYVLDDIAMKFKGIKKAVDGVIDNKAVIGIDDDIADRLLKAADDVRGPVLRVHIGVKVLVDFYGALHRLAYIIPADAAPVDVGGLDHLVFFGRRPVYCVADLLDVLPDAINPFDDGIAFAGMVDKIRIKDLRPNVRIVYRDRDAAPMGYD